MPQHQVPKPPATPVAQVSTKSTTIPGAPALQTTHRPAFAAQTPQSPAPNPAMGLSSMAVQNNAQVAQMQPAKLSAYVVPPEKREKIDPDNGERVSIKNEDRTGVIGRAFNSLNSQGPSDHLNAGGEALFGTPGF